MEPDTTALTPTAPAAPKETFVVLMTPEQRCMFFNFTHDEKQKVKDGGSEGRRYRRVQNALALNVIGRVGRRDGGVSAKHALDTSPSAFLLTLENVEFIIDKYVGAERGTSIEDVLGPFFDDVEEIKAGRYVSPTIPCAFDADADAKAWIPPPPKEKSA